MRDAGISGPFVQENHAVSRARGTIRGLHFQIAAAAQAKLIRCPRGRVLDTAVDIRRGVTEFWAPRHVAVVLNAKNWKQLFVPVGFAHGCCTLEADSEVIVSAMICDLLDEIAKLWLGRRSRRELISWNLLRIMAVKRLGLAG